MGNTLRSWGQKKSAAARRQQEKLLQMLARCPTEGMRQSLVKLLERNTLMCGAIKIYGGILDTPGLVDDILAADVEGRRAPTDEDFWGLGRRRHQLMSHQLALENAIKKAKSDAIFALTGMVFR